MQLVLSNLVALLVVGLMSSRMLPLDAAVSAIPESNPKSTFRPSKECRKAPLVLVLMLG